jgi:RNA polymerase sigma factor (sigma-70 family)
LKSHIGHDEQKLENKEQVKDGSFFWKSWEQYRGELYLMCLKIMKGSVQEAEDALSTAMLAAWEKYPQNAVNIYSLKGWLIRLTRNVCFDILRKRKKETKYEENIKRAAASNRERIDDALCFESAEDCVHREEILNRIYKSIKNLPKRLQEPAILRFFLKMPHQDIALQCNLSHANTRKRIQEARALLIKEFQDVPVLFKDFFLSNKKTKTTNLSPSWLDAEKEIETILNRTFQEIDMSCSASNLVQLSLPPGIEKSKQVFLKVRPSRQRCRVKTLQKYVNDYPGGWKKRMELAELLYAMGKWDQAIAEFRLALKKHPRSLDAWLYLGEMLRNIEQEKRAVEILEAAFPFARKQATKLHLRGMIELCHYRLEPAITAFTKAASLEESNDAHFLRLAMAYLLTDRPVEALDALENALNIKPRNLLSLTQMFDCLVLTDRLKKAEHYVDQALEIYPDDILALKRKVDQRCFQGLVRNKEGKNTRKMLRKMKQKAPHAAEVQESQAIYYFYRGEYRKGLELLKCFALERDNRPYGWYYYGCWLYRTGFYQLAAQAVIKGFGLYKKDPLVHCSICEILTHAGEREELKIVIQDMLNRFPQHWSTCSSAALALAGVFGEMERACDLSARAVKFQPGLPEAYFRYGRVLGMAGETTAAIDILLKGWRLLPEDDIGPYSTQAAWFLAQSYKTLKNEEQTRAWFDEVVHRAEQLKHFFPAEGFYWQGKALHELGDISGAIQALGQALCYQLFYPARQEAKSILRRCAGGIKKERL